MDELTLHHRTPQTTQTMRTNYMTMGIVVPNGMLFLCLVLPSKTQIMSMIFSSKTNWVCPEMECIVMYTVLITYTMTMFMRNWWSFSGRQKIDVFSTTAQRLVGPGPGNPGKPCPLAWSPATTRMMASRQRWHFWKKRWQLQIYGLSSGYLT